MADTSSERLEGSEAASAGKALSGQRRQTICLCSDDFVLQHLSRTFPVGRAKLASATLSSCRTGELSSADL